MDQLIAGLLRIAEEEGNDHVQFTSAIAFCLGYDRSAVDEQLLRLAALSHERPIEEKEKFRHKLPEYADFLSQAWEMLENQKKALDQAASPTDLVPQLPDDEALAILYWAHMAASERLGGGASYTDSEGAKAHLPASREEMEHHPLRGRGRVALVYGGATKIKGYVFESARLPEVRGASTLLDRINLADVPALWGQQNPMAGEISAIVQAPECVIYASGGNFLAFAPVSKAAELADAVEKRYTAETLIGNSAVVWEAFSLLELQYGRQPWAFWLEEDEPGMRDPMLKPVLEAYYSYPRDLRPQSPEGYFYQRKTFGELVTVLASKMMRRRGGWGDEDNRLRRHIPHFGLLPYAVKCHSCDVRPAILRDDRAEKEYCEPCARKRVMGQLAKDDRGIDWFEKGHTGWKPRVVKPWDEQFQDFLNEDRHADLREAYFARGMKRGLRTRKRVTAARDLHEIGAGSDPERYVGLIYADGNNVGAEVARLATPRQYRQFARDLFEATKEAVFLALARHLGPVFVAEANRETRVEPSAWVHPFEIVTIGGDDLILIVPGSKALEIALSIGLRLEKILGKSVPEAERPNLYENQRYQRYVVGDQGLQPADDRWPYEPRISLSAGVVIAHETTPIFFLHNLAEQLQKSAKRWRKGKHYKAGTVDFLVLRSIGMVSSRLDEFRRRALVNPAGHRLTARPYTWIELKGLLETVRALQKSGFARSQIFQMQDYLAQGLYPAAINYLYNFTRLGHEGRRELARAFHLAWHQPLSDGSPHMPPWRYLKRDDKRGCKLYETIWRDLVEIYDFVERREEA